MIDLFQVFILHANSQHYFLTNQQTMFTSLKLSTLKPTNKDNILMFTLIIAKISLCPTVWFLAMVV